MKWIIKMHQFLRELRCNHVYIDLQRNGFERCVFCEKEKPKKI
jgi:hypothetical protein